MREQLLGYLLDAIETDERDAVEQELQHNRDLQRDLELLHEGLEPLRASEAHWQFAPPAGLAERTCRAVLVRAARERVVPPPLSAAGSRWSLSDFAVAAGIFIAAGFLLFPAIQSSRENARIAGCQNNLRELGAALAGYSERNGGTFPFVPPSGNESAAGIYAVHLKNSGLLDDERKLVCPSSTFAQEGRVPHVPTFDELRGARGEQLRKLQREMGGSYGYNLGVMDGDRVVGLKNRHRPNFAMMADAPSESDENYRSDNHRGEGQNVLFEDGHVEYLKDCRARGCGDHIYKNDGGFMAAGHHESDAVIGRSDSRPIITNVSFDK